jgi:hypothetical protein
MIVTKSSMKNVFQNTKSSTFLFLQMVLNSCHKCYTVKLSKSSRSSNKKWEEKNDYDEYDGGDDYYIDELFGLIYKHK